MKNYTLGLLVCICYILSLWHLHVQAELPENEWIEPNQWMRSEELNSLEPWYPENENCKCEPKTAADANSDNLAAIFIFKKFVKQLFNREKLQYDEQFKIYQRELVFNILPGQLEQLESLDDPRDLDSLLTEIFTNSRTPNTFSNGSTAGKIFALIWDILKDLVLLLRFKEMQFITTVSVVIIIGWFIHRKHNIGIIAVVLGGMLVFGYFATYLECNRELEVKQMLDMLDQVESKQPKEPRWYTPLTSFFGSSTEEQAKAAQREQIKKASKLNLAFCRPDHVALMYANEIFMKQLQFLIKKFTTTLEDLKSLSFPYNYIASIALVCIICTIIKLTFEHILSPRVWTGYFRRSSTTTNAIGGPSLHQLEDRISGENLKKLLNAINPPNIVQNNASLLSTSCVQAVLEPIELLPLQETDNDAEKLNSSSCSSDSKSSSDTASSKSLATAHDSSVSSSSKEQISAQPTKSTIVNKGIDKEFVFITELQSKVTLEDCPDDSK